MSDPATGTGGSAIAVEEPWPSVLLSHATGNQNVRNALRSLVEHGMLGEFWTSLAWDPESRWNRWLPSGLRAQLNRRIFEGVAREQVRCAPSREIVRLGARHVPAASMLCSGERPFSVIGAYRHLDRQVAKRLQERRFDAVYAYEGGALRTFGRAKEQGAACLCEMQSSHWRWWRNLLQEEAERNPGYAGLLPPMSDLTRHFQEKDEELFLADVVLVPSEHVKQTLTGVIPQEKVRVVSYGTPPLRIRKQVSLDANVPLKVLYVGALSQSKGIGYLLDAIDQLGAQVDLTLVGRRLYPHARADEACRRWNWFEHLPHSRVLDLMQQCDVLVLPSLAEGCALVVLEALACGLPVIVTPNTGTLGFVRDGREGFVVAICSADQIADRLNRMNHDRDLLAEMSKNAQRTAATLSWETYRETWAEIVKVASCR